MSDASYVEDEDHEVDEATLTVEERARIRGWKPLEEFRGDPTQWRSAEEFMSVGQDPNVLASENRRLAGRLARVEGRLTRLQKTSEDQVAAMAELRSLARRADQQGYERARGELLEERRVAVETGDTSAFDQIEERLGALDKERRETTPPPAPPAQIVIDPAITAFQAANASWFVPGSDLHRAMCAHFEIVERSRPDETVAAQLEHAKKRLIADFPERFPRAMVDQRQPDDEDEELEPQPRRRAPSVAPPSPPARQRQRQAQGFDVIEDPQERAEARSSYDRIRAADPGMTEAEYLEIYNNPRADAIALRAARKP